MKPFDKHKISNLSFLLLADGMVAITFMDSLRIAPIGRFLDTLRMDIGRGDRKRGEYILRVSAAVCPDMEPSSCEIQEWEIRCKDRLSAVSARDRLLCSLSITAQSPSLTHSPQRATRRSLLKWIGIATAVACIGVYLASPVAVESEFAASAYSTAEVKADGFLSASSLQTIESIAREAGIPLLEGRSYGRKAVPVYVLSNPLCTTCESVEKVLMGLPVDYVPVIIPVGIEKDSTGRALRAMSQIYCANQPDVKWSAIARAQKVDMEIGECNWRDRMQLAVMASVVAGIDDAPGAPPYVIAQNGAIHKGEIVGKDPVQSLTTWLQANKT